MEFIKLSLPEYSYEMTEQIKTLRTNIQFAGNDKKVIMITSSAQGEGKSSVAFDLAVSLAELKKKVLLVDADLRASVMIGKIQGEKPQFGLSHYLSGQAALAETVYKTNVKGLCMIAAGPVPPNPTELFSSSVFDALFLNTRKLFDYIIVDAAPLGMVIDAAIISKNCDASILVVESGAIKYKFLQEVKKKLEDTGCPIIGAVLTKVSHKNSGRYYGKYKKYNKYGK